MCSEASLLTTTYYIIELLIRTVLALFLQKPIILWPQWPELISLLQNNMQAGQNESTHESCLFNHKTIAACSWQIKDY